MEDCVYTMLKENEYRGIYHCENGNPYNYRNDFALWITDKYRSLVRFIETTYETDEIEPYAFAGCAEAERAIIEDRVSIIPRHCFDGCLKLRTVQCAGKIVRIDDDAFLRCMRLSSLEANLSELVEIGASAFYKCILLEELDLSKSTKLKRIGNDAFCDCTLLETIHINCPELEEIGEYAFNGCICLKEIDLSKCTKLKKIDKKAFNHCYAKVIFPEGFNLAKND